MERISVAEAALCFDAIIDQVVRDRVTIELSRGDTVVAMISPIQPVLDASELNEAFRSLPSLG